MIDVPRSRRHDPATSDQYPSDTEVSDVQQRVLMLLLLNGPKCDRHLIDLYRGHYPLPEQYASDSSIRSRRAELVEKGLVAYAGTNVILRGLKRDREHQLWVVTVL